MSAKSTPNSNEELLNSSFDRLAEIFNQLSREDKAQFLMDVNSSVKISLGLDLSARILFPEIQTLIEDGNKKRWKPSYLIITINSYEPKDIRRVLGRLNTFAKKNEFELEELNMGYDNPDSYHEISLRLRNNWVEYKLSFEKYINKENLMAFLNQFPEIVLGGKDL